MICVPAPATRSPGDGNTATVAPAALAAMVRHSTGTMATIEPLAALTPERLDLALAEAAR